MAGLAVRYATALFELATEKDKLDDTFEQAAFLRDTLKDADCQRVISHPRIPTNEKIAFFENAFAGKIENDILGLVSLAIKKDREEFLVSALTAFIQMVNDHKRQTTAYVTSAVPLSNEQEGALSRTLSGKLNKQVTLQTKTDPNIIGGFKVFVDGYLLDRTVKKQFQDIKKSLHAM
jgi:F-type H+-transporting ATPase subunit delta